MANKTILVTGSTGWLGGKLCEALVARGVNVVGLARCVEYALVSEAFLREANGAVMCATEAT